MIKILFQGDSITDGNRFKDPELRWDLNHQIGHSYAFIVAGKLGFENLGKYTFVNRGVSGDCVHTIAKRWQKDTIEENPDVLSILLGINGNGNRDGKYEEGAENHLVKFEREYKELLTSARQANPNLKLIIIEPFALPVGELKAHYDEFMAIFVKKQAIVKKIAEEFNAEFIPVQKRLEGLVEKVKEQGYEGDCNAYWLWDGVHATEPMHAFMAGLWLDAFNKIM